LCDVRGTQFASKLKLTHNFFKGKFLKTDHKSYSKMAEGLEPSPFNERCVEVSK